MKRSVYISIVLFVLSNAAFSQIPLDIAGKAFIGMTIRDAIDHASNEAKKITFLARDKASLVVARSANEMNVLIQNANNMFGDQIDRVITKTDKDLLLILNNIDQINSTAKEINSTLIRVEEYGALDLQNIMNSVRMRDIEFYFSSVQGFTHYKRKMQDYELSVVGLGVSLVGLDGRKDESRKISVLIDGNKIPDDHIRSKDSRSVQIIIPNRLLVDKFEKSRINNNVNVTLKSDITKRRGLFGKHSTKSYEATFQLVLLPEEAGKAKITDYYLPKVYGSEQQYTEIREYIPRGTATARGISWSDERSVSSSDCKITRVSYRCDGEDFNESGRVEKIALWKNRLSEFEKLLDAGMVAAFGYSYPHTPPDIRFFLKDPENKAFKNLNVYVRPFNNSCGWCSSYTNRGSKDYGLNYGPDYEIVEGGKRVIMRRFYNNPDRDVTFFHTVFYQCIDKNAPLLSQETNFTLSYGEKSEVTRADGSQHQKVEISWFNNETEVLYSENFSKSKLVTVSHGSDLVQKLVFDVKPPL